MTEPHIRVSSRRTLLACAGAACAAALAGCARGSSGNAGMAVSQPAQGSSATGPPWASRAAAGVDQAVLGQPASGQSSSPQPASGQSSSPQPASGQSSPPQPASGQAPSLALTSDVPVGGGKILADKKIVITQPRAGSFEAFTAICTHQGCTVSDVSGGTVNCPCHGSKFSIANGSVVTGPAAAALAPVSIKVQGTSIVQA
jgi:Rieske Fe-S protein